jgi:hypothetical protein
MNTLTIQDADGIDLTIETLPREDGFIYGTTEDGIDTRLTVDAAYKLYEITMDVAAEKVKQLIKETLS